MAAAIEPARRAETLHERRQAARQEWIWPALSCAVVLACILVSNPFNEIGFCDDWSYGWTARKLAATGHLQYNGWASPILLFQTLWVFPWLRIFGSAAQVLQISMIPVALGYILLVYATARQIGLPPKLACFACLAIGTSPLFLPLAATFMTDVSGCFFSMLCIYAALKSASSRNNSASVRWLWTLAAAGAVGGANRQIVWIAPLTLIPYLAWMARRDSQFVRQAAAAYVLSIAFILVILRCFGQPYPAVQLSSKQLPLLLGARYAAASFALLANLVMVAMLVSVPVFCCLLPAALRTGSAAMAAAVAVPALAVLEWKLAGLLAPYGGSILRFEWLPMDVLPLWVRLLLSVAANFCLMTAVLQVRRNPLRLLRQSNVLWVFGLFSLGYAALLVPGILTQFAFDRYMLPLLPLVALPALREASHYLSSPPLVAWLCLAIFGSYGVAVTHDYFENLRARIASAQKLEAVGTRRDRISAGFEYDGSAALARMGHVIGARFEDRFVSTTAKGFWPEFWNHVPGFCPDFVVLDSYSGVPAPKVVLSTRFRAWLPPFERSEVAWKRTDLTAMFFHDLKQRSPGLAMMPSPDPACSSEGPQP